MLKNSSKDSGNPLPPGNTRYIQVFNSFLITYKQHIYNLLNRISNARRMAGDRCAGRLFKLAHGGQEPMTFTSILYIAITSMHVFARHSQTD